MPRLLHALVAIGVAASLGAAGAAQDATPSPTGDVPKRTCTYYPTGPLPHPSGIPPHVEYDATSHLVTVAIAFVPNVIMRDHVPYFLSTVNHAPERLNVEGPIPLADAIQRFGVPSSARAREYWTLKGILPSPAPFAVYFDEVWPGIDSISNRPCSTASRRVVATATEGAQRENERGPAGPLPFVKLVLPVSTATLSILDVAPPNRLRLLDPQSPVRSVIRFRTAEFRGRLADDALMNLDTRRGFDVSITTFTSDPAALEYRYTLGQADEAGGFVIQRFAWSAGDAVAETNTWKTTAPLQPDGSWLLRVAAGHDKYVSLHISRPTDALLQILDVSAVK